jgi:Zn-dependent metalloprotease
MCRRFVRTAIFGASVLLLLPGHGLWAAGEQDVQRLRAEFGPATDVKINAATGTARFVRLAPGVRARSRAARPDVEAVAADFLARHGGVFGLTDAQGELTLVDRSTDEYGGQHLTYEQHVGGVPVFAARLKAHFDAAGQLRSVNGLTVPAGELATSPSRSAEDSARTAVTLVSIQAQREGLTARGTRLFVYRAGLLKGVRGDSHLVWQVEVGNGDDIREFVFVDAHTGKAVDQVTGVTDALHRRAYNTTANFPATPFWVEGDAFPTADVEANNVLLGSEETYRYYLNGFGRDSYDNSTGPLGGVMHGVFRRTQSCPNASWNSTFTSYCAGVSPDDVVAHEWTHAYTEYTHGLIYAWQPGALNESYSDIFGEAVDLTNGRQTDSPGAARADNFCSTFSAVPHVLTVNSPAAIAGNYTAGRAAFGPPLTSTGLTGDVVLANDGVGAGVPPAESTTDGCCAGPSFVCAENSWPNAAEIAGKIALVDRGTCGFVIKVKNAQLQGAAGVIVANHSVGGNGILTMAGVDPTVTVPSIFIGFANANTVKGQLPAPGVNATLRSNAPGLNDSYRWLVAEDSAAFGGAIRDMWSPTCLGSPGKVTDTEYQCGTGDGGGVHTNSGVPNHAFALLVDGGTYNGQTIAPIGLIKAVHIYYRAMSVYQGPASDFADHADALETSCTDLVGMDLKDPATGMPSGQSLTATDCQQVAKAALAVELRTPPTQCNFQPMLAKAPPDRCPAGMTQANVYATDFETNPIGAWTVSHTAVFPGFTPRDWVWTSDLPAPREGSALFAENTAFGSCGDPENDESGVLHALSPMIVLPPGAANPRLTFDHYVATEAGFDGGNLKISVNGGPFMLVAAADYTYNAYNATLATAAAGNTNPMAGEAAFSGSDGGTVEGSWGRSHVNLAPYAGPGDTIQLKFDMGQDGCTGLFGWYLDDPTVYTCVQSDRELTIDDVSVVEGNTGFTTATLHVSLSQPSSRPVTVFYVTASETAKLLLDFQPDVKMVTIPPLQLQAAINVRVRGERLRESDETFAVRLFLPSGAVLADDTGRVTIVNDDVRAARP